ncbi:endoribonuclease [Escherichia phage vB_EcoM_ESCO47]|nr:endoribonuclease [Escherichia phage vB_EcoM_ESCO47]
MTTVEVFEYCYASPVCNKRALVENYEIYHFKPKRYRLTKGPFKGEEVLCTAPNARLMTSIPHFKMEFIGRKYKGLITQSLMAYDSDPILMEPTEFKSYYSGSVKTVENNSFTVAYHG